MYFADNSALALAILMTHDFRTLSELNQRFE